MMGYWVEAVEGRYDIYAGDRLRVCSSVSLRDAALIRQSLSLLESMADRFPGIINGEDDVNGGDFVDFFNTALEKFKTLKAYLAGEGDYKGDEELYDEKTDLEGQHKL